MAQKHVCSSSVDEDDRPEYRASYLKDECTSDGVAKALRSQNHFDGVSSYVGEEARRLSRNDDSRQGPRGPWPVVRFDR